VPVAGVLVAAFVRSLACRPKVTLAAEVTGHTTSSRPDGARIVANARVVLFLHNAERAGEAKNCRVTLTTTAVTSRRRWSR
jgi:hypothetical protein